MKEVGSFVRVKSLCENGYVVGYSTLVSGRFEVICWNDEKEKYDPYHVHPLDMRVLHRKYVNSKINMRDDHGRETWAQVATEMALDMNDKEWFLEIQEQRLEQRGRYFMPDVIYLENVQQLMVELAKQTEDKAWLSDLYFMEKEID